MSHAKNKKKLQYETIECSLYLYHHPKFPDTVAKRISIIIIVANYIASYVLPYRTTEQTNDRVNLNHYVDYVYLLFYHYNTMPSPFSYISYILKHLLYQ